MYFVMHRIAICIQTSVALCATLGGSPLAQAEQRLLNLDFGDSGVSSPKSGPAAVGQSSADVWNYLARDFSWSVPLRWADGDLSPASATVTTALSAYENGSADPMLNTYVFAGPNVPAQVYLTGLPPGICQLYLYGHGATSPDNGVYSITTDTVTVGPKSTSTKQSWNAPSWQEGRQYVFFADLPVGESGTVVINVLPNNLGRGLISGLQLVADVAPPPQFPLFAKVTQGPIATDNGYTLAAAWADYDNDGDLDLFVGRDRAYGLSHQLYRNDGGGVFTPTVGVLPGLESLGSVLGASWGDYDNDGHIDLVVSGLNSPCALYHNLGTGVFEQVVDSVISAEPGQFNGLAWADYDRDGDLDLFAAESGGSGGSRLYQNDGYGAFERLTLSGVEGVVGVGCAWGDYNNDGYPDLAVAGGGNGNWLFTNLGNGTFDPSQFLENDCTVEAAWGDYDNDGDLDLLFANRLCFSGVNFLYQNDGAVRLALANLPPLTTDTWNANGAAWADYDNDGDLDLFVANFSNLSGVPTPNSLYQNNGDGGFASILDAPTAEPNEGVSAAWGDYDGDGFRDLVVTQWPGPSPGTQVFHNRGNGNAWLGIQLQATESNRSCIGVRVEAEAVIAESSRRQLWETSSSDGLRDQGLAMTLGLGDAEAAERLVVRWPSGPGQAQEFTGVTGRQTVLIKENAPILMAPAGGVYAKTASVTLQTGVPKTQIRYTLDGSTPTANSRLYTTPITLRKTTTVRAAAFGNDGQVGLETSATYTLNR